MKYFHTFFIFIISSQLFSQEEYVQTNNLNWEVTNNIGFATIEIEDVAKINTTIIKGEFTKNFNLGKDFSLKTGIGSIRVKGDYNNEDNNQLYITNTFITVPITAKYIVNFLGKTGLYIEAGFYGAYLLNSKQEIISISFSNNEKGLGFNFGGQVALGVIHTITENINFSIGLHTGGDFFQNYKNELSNIKIIEFYALQLGIAFNL